MATTIRVKRKKSTGNNGVVLKAGEPYYNLFDRQLYVGDGSTDFPERSVTHIHEYHRFDDDTVAFSIGPNGEDDRIHNFYVKKINNVDVAKGIILHDMYYGDEAKRAQLSEKFPDGKIPAGTVFFQEAE